MGKYYIIDLERTVNFNQIVFWKPSSKGYTIKLAEAGLYGGLEAFKIRESDLMKTTLLVEQYLMDADILKHWNDVLVNNNDELFFLNME